MGFANQSDRTIPYNGKQIPGKTPYIFSHEHHL
jgi:hypothetical protein